MFGRAPYAAEIFNKENKEKFNLLEADKRQLIKKFIETGDLALAAKSAGFTEESKDLLPTKQEKDFKSRLLERGIDDDFLIDNLRECVEAKSPRLDKNGEVFYQVDFKTKLKAIEILLEAKGHLGKPSQEKEKKKRGDQDVLELFNDSDG